MKMPVTIHPLRRSLAVRRFGGTTLLLLLIGILVVPLISALSVCAMSCCHPSVSVAASATSANTCCTISLCDAGSDAVVISRAVTPQRTLATAGTAAGLTFALASNLLVVTDLATRDFQPPDRPLHIRNSVFLI